MPRNSEIPTDKLKATLAADHSLLSECGTFLSSVKYSIIQEPYDGVRQLLSHANITVAPRHLADKPLQSDGFAIAGSFVGSTVKFWLVNQAMGKLTRIGRLGATSTWQAEALKMGLTGSAIEAATPISEDGQFARHKATSMIESLGSFAVFGAANGQANELGLLGRAGFRTYLADSIVNGLSGTASGITGAELHALLQHGRTANLTELAGSAAGNMALGFGLASLDRLMPGRGIRLKAAADGCRTSDASTEEWVSKHYDGKTEIRAPILTWLAENKPKLRPPNYQELRARAWQETSPVDLNLSDWASHQRPSVIRELRRLSQSALASDSNIDAFISRLTRPHLQNLASEFGKSVEAEKQSQRELEKEWSKHPELANTSLLDLLYNQQTREQLKAAGNENLLELATRYEKLGNQADRAPEKKLFEQALQIEFDAIRKELGSPQLEVHPVAMVGGECDDHPAQRMWIGTGEQPSMSATTLKTAYHEFTHHIQGGRLYGKETLAYYAKLPFYKVSQFLELQDSIPISPEQAILKIATRRQFINSYVGYSNERQAHAIALLTQIRAIAAGLPI